MNVAYYSSQEQTLSVILHEWLMPAGSGPSNLQVRTAPGASFLSNYPLEIFPLWQKSPKIAEFNVSIRDVVTNTFDC